MSTNYTGWWVQPPWKIWKSHWIIPTIGESPFLIGKPSINGPFPVAMLVITRGYLQHVQHSCVKIEPRSAGTRVIFQMETLALPAGQLNKNTWLFLRKSLFLYPEYCLSFHGPRWLDDRLGWLDPIIPASFFQFVSQHLEDYHYHSKSIFQHCWLVVSTPLKNISQLGWLFPIYGKIKNVPNHQPDWSSNSNPNSNPIVLMLEDWK